MYPMNPGEAHLGKARLQSTVYCIDRLRKACELRCRANDPQAFSYGVGIASLNRLVVEATRAFTEESLSS